MTDFKFPDDKETYSFLPSKIGKISSKNINFQSSKTKELSELTESLQEYLSFLINHNLIPKLPNKINIVYVSEDSLIHKISQAFNKTYEYPACMNPYTNTLYISNDFKRNSDLESNQYITKTRNFFNGSISKSLEYAFGHELGHFFLITKNKENNLLAKKQIVLSLARNIEEGFSEAFSIQIMNIKYPNLLNDTNNLKELLNYRNSKRDLHLKTLLPNTKLKNIIDSYYFPLIYQNLPLKDSNGNIEKDINKIYEKCHQLSLDNNKEVIKDVLNNNLIIQLGLSNIFKNNLTNFLIQSDKNLKNISKTNLTDDELVKNFHNKINSMSFNTKKIIGLRNLFIDKNDSKLKP